MRCFEVSEFSWFDINLSAINSTITCQIMFHLFNKTLLSIKSDGLAKTVKKIVKYPLESGARNIHAKKILAHSTVEDRFTEMYKRNYWGTKETASGSGSTLEYTENLRNKLPELFSKYSIKTVFDAPCGDFNWMKHVVAEGDFNYIGGDVVLPMVSSHISKYENYRTKFIHIDLTKEKFPNADLMICRDCLFHLSIKDAESVILNYISSNIPYLLTTTHINNGQFRNKDVASGDFRLLDLFSAPYYFPQEVLFRITDWIAPEPQREMCLWTREQVIDAVSKSKK